MSNENDMSEAEDAVTGEASTPRMSWKIVVVGLLILLILIAIIARKQSQSVSTSSPLANPESSASQDFTPETVLATVNGTPITLADFNEDMQELPEEYRAQLATEQHLFLSELIVSELMLQEAKAQKLMESEAYVKATATNDLPPEHEERILIGLLLDKEVFGLIEVSEDELRSIYEQNKALLPEDKTFEDVREFLRERLQQAKGMEPLQDYIVRLKSSAKIDLNHEWIELQLQATADNPLDNLLGKGKPVLVDFGRGTCTPCKMMKPILEKLAEDMKDTVHVLVLDLAEYEHLGRRYETRIIPAQLFFDGTGKQLYRHEGFMSRDDMIAKMKELGMIPE